MGARGGPETIFRVLKVPRGLHQCKFTFLSRMFAQQPAIRQTFEAVPSVPIFQKQQLDLKSILTVPYQLGRGLDPSRLPRAPNL